MKKQLILLVAVTAIFVTPIFAQKGYYRINNGIGITGGLTKFNIITDNFITKQGNGFLGGLTATVDLAHKPYDLSYGMQLSESIVEISGRPTMASTEETFVEYKVFAAQLAFLGHIKIIPYHFTIDLGPMVQYNSKLELKDKEQKGYYINNYENITAEDIANISRFNVNGAIGASAGIKNLKLKAQYIYGFTNMLKKLEKQNLDTTGGSTSFKGNQSMIVLSAMFSF
ncbi:porin family protein [Flavivirga eckloniae]|uniref:Outer membrane protein beta-barrel domain-containing protein n=1 Tax=Flavivirga eckloniae TaxID=1803846 RepID=A0A2K9PQW5_9FLAO|nr:hypothetical protein [Flavivirga eckloniae]AUP79435.1 hypothetical protein C1H87_12245 [Flavivirga eckloniae]